MQRRLLFASLLMLFVPAAAWCKSNPSITQFGHNIYVGPDQRVSDVTCFGCSVHIRGQVAGDVTTFAGSITIEDHGQVAGDITVFGGNARLDPGVKVAGDATVFGGEIHRAAEAQISGDVTNFGGHGWLVPILLTPIAFLGALVALMIWLVRRARHPASMATA